MKGAQAKQRSGAVEFSGASCPGTVVETRDGIPTLVEIDGHVTAVAGVVTPAPGIHLRYHTGAPGLGAHTKAGAMIQGALQHPGEEQRVEIGIDEGNRLVIKATNGVILKSDDATIEVLEDGKIRVSGERIYSVSKGPMTLRGSIIELN